MSATNPSASIETVAATPEQTRRYEALKTRRSTAGAEVLGKVEKFLRRFVAYPSEHARVAHVLWCAHAHSMDAWDSTPRIAFLSPEPGSGKTRALEITELLVPRPVLATNTTPAYLFRKVSDPEGRPTILFDEIDTIFGPKAKEHEEIRGMLNAGHRKGAVAGRCTLKGKVIVTEELPAYAAVALAGLGNLPDTILTRSIVIRMRRRAPNEIIEPFRRREHAEEGESIRMILAALMSEWDFDLECARPAMPAGLADRAADVWEPLLAIADLMGDEWSKRARVSAVSLVTDAMGASPSLGVRLLTDLRTVFGEAEQLATTEILDRLNALEDSPWSDLKGKPLDARRMANYVKQYGIQSTQVRLSADRTAKGYRRTDLHDAWIRYLPSSSQKKVTRETAERPELLPQAPIASETRVTPETNGHGCPRCGGEGCSWCDGYASDT